MGESVTPDPAFHDDAAWSRRLRDHARRRLTPAEDEMVRAHLARCAACRLELDSLQTLAGAYAADPEHDAMDLTAGWARVVANLPLTAREGRARESAVGGAPPAARVSPHRRARLFGAGLAAGLALAASLLLIVRAGSRSGDAPPERGSAAEVSPTLRPRPGVPPARPVLAAEWAAGEEYLSAVAELETALRAGRDRLQPETIAAIERSLAAIDRAIREAEAALAADPANDYVGQWLETVRRRKLRALRQAIGDINALS